MNESTLDFLVSWVGKATLKNACVCVCDCFFINFCKVCFFVVIGVSLLRAFGHVLGFRERN